VESQGPRVERPFRPDARFKPVVGAVLRGGVVVQCSEQPGLVPQPAVKHVLSVLDLVPAFLDLGSRDFEFLLNEHAAIEVEKRFNQIRLVAIWWTETVEACTIAI